MQDILEIRAGNQSKSSLGGQALKTETETLKCAILKHFFLNMALVLAMP